MSTEKALAVVEGEFSIVAPIVDAPKAVAAFRAYQSLTSEMLVPSDYQTYLDRGETKRFKKKSAWRKYATFYGLSLSTLDTRVGHRHDKNTCARLMLPDEKECGCPTVYARIVVQCIAPNGRTTEGIGVSSLEEKNRRFTKPDHEIPATAYTRAANRAISDMIGAGEDSAEEVRGTAEAEGLSLEDKAAIKEAWGSAPEERRGAASGYLRANGFDGGSVAQLFTDFNRRGSEEQVVDLLGKLRGVDADFDPDELP
jgi:hypothetical protein